MPTQHSGWVGKKSPLASQGFLLCFFVLAYSEAGGIHLWEPVGTSVLLPSQTASEDLLQSCPAVVSMLWSQPRAQAAT